MYLYFLLDYGAPFTLEGDLLKTTKAFDFEMQQSVKVAVNAMAFGSNLHGEFTVCDLYFSYYSERNLMQENKKQWSTTLVHLINHNKVHVTVKCST